MSNFYDNVSAIQNISGIVQNENARLDAKQMNIDQAYNNQKRMILLNQSYGQRMQHYTFIAILLAVTFVVVALLLYLQKGFPMIPSYVFDLIMIFLIGGVCIYILNLYSSITSRDKLDFSKISPESPNMISDDELKKQQAKDIAEGKLSSTTLYGTCVGSMCCPEGQEFDDENNQCRQRFTTLEQAYSNNEIIPK